MNNLYASRHFIFKGLFFILFIFSLQEANAQDSVTLPPELNEFREKLRQSYVTEDAELRASLFKENGVHITGWGEEIKGREAIQKFYETVFAKRSNFSTGYVPHEVTKFGNYIVTRGIATLKGTNTNGEEFSGTMHYAVLVEKIDGEWKIVWDLTGPEVATSNGQK